MVEKAVSVVATRQAPLRDRYREHSQEAITEKHVRATVGEEGDPLHGCVESIGYEGSRHSFGIDEKIGGYGDLPNPGHLLCAALAACFDSTLRMLADRLGLDLKHCQVDVVGHVDVRGCLALSDAVRPGFTDISCTVALEMDPSVDPRRASFLVEHAEKLCVTLDTLRNGVDVRVSLGDARCPEIRTSNSA
jgi:uncharacterized OsmC-like protein